VRDTVLLAAYAGAVIASTFVHDARVLAAGILVALLLAGRRAPRLARRALTTVLLFHGSVMISYAVASHLSGKESGPYLLLATTRVLGIAFLTFLVADRLNLFRALAFSRVFSTALIIAYGQIVTFRHALRDFLFALRSRSADPPSLRRLFLHRGVTGAWFLRKSLRASTEITAAMKSRGLIE